MSFAAVGLSSTSIVLVKKPSLSRRWPACCSACLYCIKVRGGWKAVPAGDYAITAKATDNDTMATTSDSVRISVINPKSAPFLSITRPVATDTFIAPESFTISANANDTDGSISKVDFYSNDTLIGTANESPYTFTWKSVPAGNYSITAKATDNDAMETTSASVRISVANPKSTPFVSIISPAAIDTFIAPASITVSATAEDTDGSISKVDFYINDTLIGTDTEIPYTFKDSIIVKCAPNPATNIMNISTEGFEQNKPLYISVIASGLVLKIIEVNNASQSIQIDVSSLLSGIYTLKVACGDKVVSKQFLKL